MRRNTFNISGIVIVVCGLLFCGLVYAQGPINNAVQFQQKAIKSALKGSGNQSFGPKKDADRIEWADDSDASDANEASADDEALPINIQAEEEVAEN